MTVSLLLVLFFAFCFIFYRGSKDVDSLNHGSVHDAEVENIELSEFELGAKRILSKARLHARMPNATVNLALSSNDETISIWMLTHEDNIQCHYQDDIKNNIYHMRIGEGAVIFCKSVII